MKEVITLVLAIFVFLVLYIWSIRNYSSFFSVAIYYIIAIILFSIFGGIWGFTLSFLFSYLVAMATDDDGKFTNKKDEANNSSQSYFDVDKIMNSGIVKNEIHNTVVRLTKSHVDGIGYVPPAPEPFPPVFCKPTKRFSSSGKEIPSNLDISEISYETVIRIEDLGTPVPSYYVYFKSCKGISKKLSSKRDINLSDYYIGKRTGIFYNGIELLGDEKYVFEKLHPIGSTIYGYVKDESGPTFAFPLEKEVYLEDRYTREVLAEFDGCSNESFKYYCKEGNIIEAVVANYIEKNARRETNWKLKLSRVVVTYTKS